MLQIRHRILLAAFAAVFAGAAGGWALLAVLPSEAAPHPAVASSAFAYKEVAHEEPVVAPISAPPPPVVATPAPAAPERTAKAPPAPASPGEDPPATTGREFGFKFEDGSSASLDPENGRVRLRTPFGNLDLRL